MRCHDSNKLSPQKVCWKLQGLNDDMNVPISKVKEKHLNKKGFSRMGGKVCSLRSVPLEFHFRTIPRDKKCFELFFTQMKISITQRLMALGFGFCIIFHFCFGGNSFNQWNWSRKTGARGASNHNGGSELIIPDGSSHFEFKTSSKKTLHCLSNWKLGLVESWNVKLLVSRSNRIYFFAVTFKFMRRDLRRRFFISSSWQECETFTE